MRPFIRDLKKMKKRGKDLSKLKILSDILALNINVPEKYKKHKLLGNYKGHWECHIEPDWVLIYKKTDDILIFMYTGSHSDLL